MGERHWVIVFVVVLIVLAALSGIGYGDGEIRFRAHAEIQPVSPGDQIQIQLRATIAPGWHLYSLTPYPKEVNLTVYNYLKQNNLEIDSFNSFNLNYDSEIAQVSLESLKESIAKINLDNVDGLFVSCTALKIVDILDEVEKKFNTTVISSNQAIIWDCLQLLDMNVKIPGYGCLLYTSPSPRD